MPDKDIDNIPITVEVPKADVWLRADYRDIVHRLGEVHLIRACEHQHDDDFVPMYDFQVIEQYQIEAERLRAQLPEGMGHCTILFKECEKGHGRLTAANWVQHGCQTCEIEGLREDAERYRWLRGEASEHSERWMRWELRRWDGKSWHPLERSSLDAAIDAARKRP